jgi:hypothetical protein
MMSCAESPSNGKFFRFYDSSTINKAKGTSDDNKLYYNSTTGKITLGKQKVPMELGLDLMTM